MTRRDPVARYRCRGCGSRSDTRRSRYDVPLGEPAPLLLRLRLRLVTWALRTLRDRER